MLWKRANPQTDMELVYQRYSGRSANAGGGKALWLAFPFGCVNMGWVNKAMTVIINYTIPEFPRLPLVDSLMLWLVVATPLSSQVDPQFREAIQSGQLQPMEIAYEHASANRLSGQRINRVRMEAVIFLKAMTKRAKDARKAGNRSHWVERLALDQPRAMQGVPPEAVAEGWDAFELTHQIYLISSTVNQYKVLFLLFLVVVAYTPWVACGGSW